MSLLSAHTIQISIITHSLVQSHPYTHHHYSYNMKILLTLDVDNHYLLVHNQASSYHQNPYKPNSLIMYSTKLQIKLMICTSFWNLISTFGHTFHRLLRCYFTAHCPSSCYPYTWLLLIYFAKYTQITHLWSPHMPSPCTKQIRILSNPTRCSCILQYHDQSD